MNSYCEIRCAFWCGTSFEEEDYARISHSDMAEDDC
jgi:hypothetical protein